MELVYVRRVKFPKELIFTTRNLLLLFSHPRLFSFSACMCVRLYRMYKKCVDKFQERVLYTKTKEKTSYEYLSGNKSSLCLIEKLHSTINT